MPQSRPGESDHHGELDPLLAFNAELAAAKSPQKPVDPAPLAAAPLGFHKILYSKTGFGYCFEMS